MSDPQMTQIMDLFPAPAIAPAGWNWIETPNAAGFSAICGICGICGWNAGSFPALP